MSIFNIKRIDHNFFYLNEGQYLKHKEYFKKTFPISKNKCDLNLNADLNFIDRCCSSGDCMRLIKHSLKNNRNVKILGSDVMLIINMDNL